MLLKGYSRWGGGGGREGVIRYILQAKISTKKTFILDYSCWLFILAKNSITRNKHLAHKLYIYTERFVNLQSRKVQRQNLLFGCLTWAATVYTGYTII
jgi:hypothetical protein